MASTTYRRHSQRPISGDEVVAGLDVPASRGKPAQVVLQALIHWVSLAVSCSGRMKALWTHYWRGVCGMCGYRKGRELIVKQKRREWDYYRKKMWEEELTQV